ncbi:hypothetical protein E4U32_002022 [Claviceps aff. humidiphila group G2b]|nr:hypothetical protein E4U32_002022 [Claviceps aff. humidiphila group G2b]
MHAAQWEEGTRKTREKPNGKSGKGAGPMSRQWLRGKRPPDESPDEGADESAADEESIGCAFATWTGLMAREADVLHKAFGLSCTTHAALHSRPTPPLSEASTQVSRETGEGPVESTMGVRSWSSLRRGPLLLRAFPRPIK